MFGSVPRSDFVLAVTLVGCSPGDGSDSAGPASTTSTTSGTTGPAVTLSDSMSTDDSASPLSSSGGATTTMMTGIVDSTGETATTGEPADGCAPPPGTPRVPRTPGFASVLERWSEARPGFLVELDPGDPTTVDGQTLAYYHVLARTHVLWGNLQATFLEPAQLDAVIDEMIALGDDLVAMEMFNNPDVTAAREQFAAYYPPDDPGHRGWAYFSETFYAGWPEAYVYDPAVPGSTGSHTAIDHTHPPFHSYAIETANALLALSQIALVLRAYDCRPERVASYQGLADDVLQHWTDAHYKVHDGGYEGWTYEEFETETILGVAHHEDYYAFNSNAMMAAASLDLNALRGDEHYLPRAQAVAAVIKDAMVLDGSAYVWNFGHNNAYWDANPPGLEVVEDTSHAAWDLIIFTWGFLDGNLSIYGSDIEAAHATLTDNVLGDGVVYRYVDGTVPYPEQDGDPAYWHYLVAEWSHLALAYAQYDYPTAVALLEEMAAVIEPAGYGYYHLLFDGVWLRVHAADPRR